jgi:hypothetical protein
VPNIRRPLCAISPQPLRTRSVGTDRETRGSRPKPAMPPTISLQAITPNHFDRVIVDGRRHDALGKLRVDLYEHPSM